MQKHFNLAVIATAVLLSTSLFATARPKTQTWTGWISDSLCGAKGMSANHKQCAIECVKAKGAKWVFVNSQTNKVLSIQNQKAINQKDLGRPVKVSGNIIKGKGLHVESIQPEN